jgi:predicted nucleic acid-binding protein
VVLVDTSVWIDFITGRTGPAVRRLRDFLDRAVPVAITSQIFQEILQGATSSERFQEFESYFGSQRFLHPVHPITTYVRAARLYFECRQAGVTLRSSIDCMIAAVAVEHGALLLHSDRDFERIAQVFPQLKFA